MISFKPQEFRLLELSTPLSDITVKGELQEDAIICSNECHLLKECVTSNTFMIIEDDVCVGITSSCYEMKAIKSRLGKLRRMNDREHILVSDLAKLQATDANISTELVRLGYYSNCTNDGYVKLDMESIYNYMCVVVCNPPTNPFEDIDQPEIVEFLKSRLFIKKDGNISLKECYQIAALYLVEAKGMTKSKQFILEWKNALPIDSLEPPPEEWLIGVVVIVKDKVYLVDATTLAREDLDIIQMRIHYLYAIKDAYSFQELQIYFSDYYVDEKEFNAILLRHFTKRSELYFVK